MGTAARVSALRCRACGWSPGPDDPYPFRCANAGTDDGDHVLVITLPAPPSDDADPNPFVVHRRALWSHHFATAHGLADADFVALVRDLDDAVAAVDGHGFRVTPFTEQPALSDRLGVGVLVKDETEKAYQEAIEVRARKNVAEVARSLGRAPASPRLSQ